MARRSLVSDLKSVLSGLSSKFKRTPNFGVTSVGLFVGSCLVVSVVVMIYNHEGYIQNYFRRHNIHQRDANLYHYLGAGDSDSADLDPDLDEDVPAAYKAFVFAPQETETDNQDWWERQVSRKEQIRRTCERVLGNFEQEKTPVAENVTETGAPLPERLLKDMALDPEDDILFCPSLLDLGQRATRWDTLLAHAGSEALRVVMNDNIRGITDVEIPSPQKIKAAAAAEAAESKDGTPQDMTWLKRFTKILFVEHPFEKIISLYKNRIQGRNGYLGQEMGKRTLMYTRGPRNVTDRDARYASPTFKEMTSFVVHRDFIDPHIKSTFEVCAPCEFDYDYIVKAETFGEDIRNIFKQVFTAPKWRKMLDKFPSFKEIDEEKVAKTMLKYYREVSEDDLLMLYDLYSIDMFMFNYQWPFDRLRVRRIPQ